MDIGSGMSFHALVIWEDPDRDSPARDYDVAFGKDFHARVSTAIARTTLRYAGGSRLHEFQ